MPTPSGELQAYRFEPDKLPTKGTVMLVHGWTSEAAFMTAMAEPIRRAGFRVVLFDLPAHGLSPGRRTNLVDCARATLAVAEAMGPLHAIVAHSFGGMVSLLAAEGRPPMPRALDTGHVVLIACPNRLADVTGEFAARRNMTKAARRAFELRLERVGRRPIDRFATAKLLPASRSGALVVHARDEGSAVPLCAGGGGCKPSGEACRFRWLRASQHPVRAAGGACYRQVSGRDQGGLDPDDSEPPDDLNVRSW